MKSKIILTLLSFFVATNCLAKIESIMLGNLDAREAKIWVLASPRAVLSVKIAEIPDFSLKTQCDEFGIAKITLSKLNPSTSYTYTIIDKDGVEESSFKTLDLYSKEKSLAFSVAVIGKNDSEAMASQDEEDSDKKPAKKTDKKDEKASEESAELNIYDQILKLNPIATIWANGIDYLRDEDFSSKSAYFNRFSADRKQKDLQNLLRKTANIGVMAINNYGPRKADATFYNKDAAHNAFMSFWQNPTFGQARAIDNAMYTQFKINDAEFFILDDCSFRDNLTYKNKKRSFLGTKQINFLTQALNASNANFKVIVMNTPMANPSETYDNFSDAKAEKATLFERIESLRIKGVICVSANKNYAEVTKMIRSSAYPIYDITAGPITEIHDETAKELNYFRVPNSAVAQKSFCILNFSGEAHNRILNIGFVGEKGELLFKHTIPLKELE